MPDPTPLSSDPLLPGPPTDTALSSYALFFSTPFRTQNFVLLMTILAHACFIYGQTQVMWYLYFSIDFDASLYAHSLPAQVAFAALEIPNPVQVDVKLNQTIQVFTYWEAIKGLWLGNTNPGVHTTNPGFWGKFSAILLVFFSGAWPHVKLISLQYQYSRQCQVQDTRTTTLYWLDTFGKWSLADVFVICTLLAVLNLDLPIDANKLAHALIEQLAVIARDLSNDATATEAARAVCQTIFFSDQGCPSWGPNHDCNSRANQCAQCACRLERAFPTADLVILAADALLRGVRASGDGLAVLRVAGRHGIYVFSCGTLLSLTLSAFVGVLDHRTRAKRKSIPHNHSEDALYRALVDARHALSPAHRQSLLSRRQSLLQTQPEPLSRTPGSTRFLPLLSLAAIGLTFAAVFVPSMRRKVPGSITELIADDLDLDFSRPFSIFELVRLTGAAGGPDYFLMGVFSLFVIVGPCVRALATAWLVIVPQSSRRQERLALLVNAVGVFAAFDVILLAFFLVGMEMPKITAGIVAPSQPVCRLLHELGTSQYCVSIELHYIWPNFLLVLAAYAVSIAVAVRVVRVAFFVFNPFDDDYPGSPLLVARLAEC